MSAWDDLAKAIDAGDTARTVALVLGLGETERREAARELPGLLKAMLARTEHGFVWPRHQEPLLLAGAGTIGGAAAAAAWLCRRDLRILFSEDGYAGFCRALAEVTAFRPDRWRAEVGRRVAARVRAADDTWFLWHAAAALARSAGGPPPVSDGFVVGWASVARPRDLAEDPFLDVLVPRLFEADGVGAALAFEPAEAPPIEGHGGLWAPALAGLAREGRLDRAALLDGCVGRFLRGGTIHELRWFTRLHAALEPTGEEAADRVRDYVRLLPAAPAGVADLALRQVRRADGLGRLDAALFEEAADALLFRPERKLVGAALTWLDRAAREPGRVDGTLRAVTAVFGSDDLDLRERAVAIAARHLPRASAPVRAEVREAAAGLPPGLLAAHPEAFGGVAADAEPEPPAGPPPFVPRPSPAPIGSLADLADELVALLRTIDRDWRTTERCLAAFVESVHRDADATREALRGPLTEIATWIVAPDAPYADGMWLDYVVRCLFFPDEREWPPSSTGPFFRTPGRVHGRLTAFSQMERFVSWRLHEVGHELGRAPVLLATPTEGSGHVSPDALVERLERLERAGAEPGLADLTQAMLRLPRRIDPSAVARARSLTSPAGRSAASWLAAGGLEDPAVECAVLSEPEAAVRGEWGPLPTGVLATVAAPGPGVSAAGGAEHAIARLCAFPEEGWSDLGTRYYQPLSVFWPSVLPSHREVTAAQLVPALAGTADHALDQGAIMRDLAEADGPTGAATGTLLALALSNKHRKERADAAEAFLALAARGDLPAAATGAALGRLVSFGRVPPARAAKALTAACDAGAAAEVWETLAASLPHLLPGPGEPAPNGAPALLELATRAAETTGARGAIPAVADAASRGGSSRVVRAAARLHRALAT